MSVSTQDLESFVADCEPKLEVIEAFLNEFNIFNVLGVQRREIRHSNFLGWLFDPNDSHQLGAIFLKDLLRFVGKAGSLNPDKLSALLSQDLSNTIVHRESENNIDILLVNEAKDFVICIENKIDANFSDHQLEKYFNYVEYRYVNIKHRCYITLTPFKTNHHISYECGAYYNNINYSQIVSMLHNQKNVIRKAKNTVTESINQYCTMIEKDITKTSKEIILAKEIYKNYRKEIDFIIRNQENFGGFKNDIYNYIESGNLEGFKFSHDSSNKKVIFILPDNEDLLKLFYYPEAESRGGGYIFSLVINFEKDSIWLKFGFGNIVKSESKEVIQAQKDRLFNSMKKFNCFNNSKLIIDLHNDSSDMEYAGICGVPLFNDDVYYEENKTVIDLFKVKFNEVNKEVIQPWIEECLNKME